MARTEITDQATANHLLRMMGLEEVVWAHDNMPWAAFCSRRDREAWEAARRGTISQIDYIGEQMRQRISTRHLAWEPEDDEGIIEVIERLRGLADSIEALRTHACEFNDDDRCSQCGADGRA